MCIYMYIYTYKWRSHTSTPWSLCSSRWAYRHANIPACLNAYLPGWWTHLETFISASPSAYLHICISAYLHICKSAYLQICISAYLAGHWLRRRRGGREDCRLLHRLLHRLLLGAGFSHALIIHRWLCCFSFKQKTPNINKSIWIGPGSRLPMLGIPSLWSAGSIC